MTSALKQFYTIPLLILVLLPFQMLFADSFDEQTLKRFLIVSPQQRMHTGVVNLFSTHRILAEGEEAILGSSWWSEERKLGNLTGMATRLLKYSLLDLPLDYFTVVLMHEYYGHGARYREFGIKGVDYGYDLPPPYGPGGGYASYSSSPDQVSSSDRIMIWVGGMESHELLLRKIRSEWMLSGNQHYREAWLYWWGFQISALYIKDTAELMSGQERFNDPQAYVWLLNEVNGVQDIQSYPFTLSELKRIKQRAAFDPFLWVSLYNNIVGYLWNADISSTVPRFSIGSIQYMPAYHISLTPFGVQSHLENYFLYDDVLYLFTLSLGDDSFHSNWGGLGLEISNPYARSNLSIDLNAQIWRQPGFEHGGELSSEGGGIGGSMILRTYWRFQDAEIPIKGIVETGWKSAGFSEGLPILAGPILAVGLQF